MSKRSHRWLLALMLAAPSLACADYQPPAPHDDGWAVADARAARWDMATLAAMEAKLNDGSVKGITSVVVAQHGKLVYEGYFNGSDASRLNDVRSASKSVTALLVGAAIDRGLIANVQARVYDFFPTSGPCSSLTRASWPSRSKTCSP